MDEITKRLDELKSISLIAVQEMLNVDDVAFMHGFKPTYIRKMVEEGKIPYYKPFGGKLFFKKTEINELLQGGKVPSISDILRTCK